MGAATSPKQHHGQRPRVQSNYLQQRAERRVLYVLPTGGRLCLFVAWPTRRTGSTARVPPPVERRRRPCLIAYKPHRLESPFATACIHSQPVPPPRSTASPPTIANPPTACSFSRRQPVRQPSSRTPTGPPLRPSAGFPARPPSDRLPGLWHFYSSRTVTQHTSRVNLSQAAERATTIRPAHLSWRPFVRLSPSVCRPAPSSVLRSFLCPSVGISVGRIVHPSFR